MLGRRAEPGDDEQGAELVAVQRDGMRLIVDPRPPDVGGRGMFKELFLDRAPVEPGDGAQPPVTAARARPRVSSSRAKRSMSARRTANKAAGNSRNSSRTLR